MSNKIDDLYDKVNNAHIEIAKHTTALQYIEEKVDEIKQSLEEIRQYILTEKQSQVKDAIKSKNFWKTHSKPLFGAGITGAIVGAIIKFLS